MNITKMIIKQRTFIDPEDGKTKSRFGYRGGNNIQWIVIHYIGSQYTQGKAEPCAKSMQNWKRTVSTHYLVGEDGIFQTVEERHTAWHCGGYKKTNKCAASNATALGVDLAERKAGTKSGKVEDSDWFFTNTVLDRGSELVAELADRYHIPMGHIVRHYDVTGKWCPRPLVGPDINTVTGRPGDDGWRNFLNMVKGKRKTV